MASTPPNDEAFLREVDDELRREQIQTMWKRYGRLALQFAREAVQRAATTTLAEGLRAEADLSTLAYRTADAEEGMRAFVERRPAQFKGS